MTSKTSRVVKHTVLNPAPFHQDPWETYGHIYCECAGGDRILLLYLRPDALADCPANHNRYDSASKLGVAFFRAWEFAVHTALFASGKPVQIEVDDVHPLGARIFTDVTLPPPNHDAVPDVKAWLLQHSNVYYALRWKEHDQGGATYDLFGNWPAQKQKNFRDAFAAAWNHQPIALQDPPPNLANYETDNAVVFSADDAWRLFCAHTAYSLAVEIGGRVPWSITGYTADDLEKLLHGGALFGWNTVLKGYELLLPVVPAPPEFTWAFLTGNNLIDTDRVSSIARVLDWCRNNLWHANLGSTLESTPGLVSSVIQGMVDGTYPEYGVRHWTGGCGFTTCFLQSLLRTVNIRVEKSFDGGHMRPHFTADDLYLSHGDDPYDASSQCTPQFDAKLLLIDKTTYNNWFGSAVPESTAKTNVGRRTAELAVQYLPDWLLNIYYQDQQNGKTPQTSEVYKQLQRYYPNFTDLYPDLWQRMDNKLAGFGAIAWPPCDFYDFDLLLLVRSQMGTTLVQNPIVDLLGNNHDFLSATLVSLHVPDTGNKLTLKIQKDEETFYDLNLLGGNDHDYFSIEYTCPKSDDVYQGTGASQEMSRYLGLWVTHYPPALYFSARNAKNYCMDMEIYRCDQFNRALYESLPRTTDECIYNPTHFLGARKCYLVLKNTDYNSQGTFAYDLVVGYVSAHDALSVETNAPAYRAQTTIQRKILKELYDRIDLPRPPDDLRPDEQKVRPGERFQRGTPINIGVFISEYEKFLEVPEVAAMLGKIAHKGRQAVVAEEYSNLGKAAQAYRLFDHAERIYLKSARSYSKARDKKSQVNVLDVLANMYAEQGKMDAAKRIRQRIKTIG